jgi:hypothetical protein
VGRLLSSVNIARRVRVCVYRGFGLHSASAVSAHLYMLVAALAA